MMFALKSVSMPEIREGLSKTSPEIYVRSVENTFLSCEEEYIVEDRSELSTHDGSHDWTPDPVLTDLDSA